MPQYRRSIVTASSAVLAWILLTQAQMASAGEGPANTNAAAVAAMAAGTAAEAKSVWRDSSKPLDARLKDLIGKMTLEEKANQICNETKAIPRLGIPAYDYWNECLHGVARNSNATVFPQAIGLAAMWDTAMLHDMADCTATEARAKHREYIEQHNGDSKIFAGLTFWTPNINIFRDPRWGRGQETYGEDTFLTARLAVAFITGLQGSDPNYIKAAACAKHFAVHSGPEADRHRFNAVPAERDLYETYLPHFEAAVREGRVAAVMGAYNRVNGTPACSSPFLLTDLLRKQWGFDGHVVSDCGAIKDIWESHRVMSDMAEAEAAAIKAGCDVGCWGYPDDIVKASGRKLLTEADIDTALTHALKTRFRLGMFDPPEQVPYAKISAKDYDTPEHGKIALQAARESMVLLKNNGVLPLDRSKIKRVAVVGFNAMTNNILVLLGNYFGIPTKPVTILQGIQEVAGTNITVTFTPGCPLALPVNDTMSASAKAAAFGAAVAAAKEADVVIYAGGIHPALEGEEMMVQFQGFAGGDRVRIELPAIQTELLKALHATGKPVVFVNLSGSAIAMPWEAENLPAILQAWYPGQAGGTAVAEVLFGDVNPAGRLPVTFYRSSDDLPAFVDYSMNNRTYRYFGGKPLFAFGHGLSYTKFDYKSVKCDKAAAAPTDTLRVSVDLANSGAKDGDEVVQVYFRHVESAVPQPKQALCGFKRVRVAQGKSAKVEIEIPVKEFRYWDTAKKQYVVEAGKYELLVGAASDDIREKIPLTITAGK
jgi:beta-glucosidase